MKISELLEKLGELQGQEGDCEVYVYHLDEYGYGEYSEPEPIKDDSGNRPVGVWL
jgi:hypothetical protein